MENRHEIRDVRHETNTISDSAYLDKKAAKYCGYAKRIISCFKSRVSYLLICQLTHKLDADQLYLIHFYIVIAELVHSGLQRV